MIAAPQEYQAALSAISRTFKASIQVNGTEIDGDIQTVDVYRGSGFESIMFGATMMPYFTAQIYDLTTALADADVDLRVGVMVSSGFLKVSHGSSFACGCFAKPMNAHTHDMKSGVNSSLKL